jgi:hypothetical protein
MNEKECDTLNQREQTHDILNPPQQCPNVKLGPDCSTVLSPDNTIERLFRS